MPEQELKSKLQPAIRTMKSDVAELFQKRKPPPAELITVGGDRNGSGAVTSSPILKKVLAAAAVLTVLTVVGWVGWVFLKPPTTKEAPKTIAFKPPEPFFAVEFSRTAELKSGEKSRLVSSLANSLKDPERAGSIRHLVVILEDAGQKRPAELTDLLEAYQITPPAGLLRNTKPPLMLFVYYGADGAKPGFAVETDDVERTLGTMFSWESKIALELRDFWGQEEAIFSKEPFEDRTFRNLDWRWQKLSETRDAGVGYAVYQPKNLLVVTFGKAAAEAVLERLLGAK